MKKNIKIQPYVSASTIVQQALINHVNPTAPTESFPKLSSLKHIANKCNQGNLILLHWTFD